jgi:hypothetical protein
MVANLFLQSLFDDMVALTAISFILVIFGAFIKFLCCGDRDDRGLQKLIGGLGVFLVAIISKSPWVFSLSIFVGGLIIASEDFMKFLAAVMKSSSDKIPETVNALLTKASHADVKAKAAEDVIETVATISMQKDEKRGELSSRLQKMRKVEGLVHSYMAKIFGKDYESQIKYTGPNGQYIFDGVIKSQNSLKFIVEIKYLSSARYEALDFSIARFTHKVKSLEINIAGMVAVVADQITTDEALKLNKELSNKFNLRFLFFKYENDILVPILVPPFLNEYNKIAIS